MNTNYKAPNGTIQRASATPKSVSKRRTLAAAVLSGALALAGLGLASGTAQADSRPAPQHYWCDGWQFVWDWDHCHFDFDYRYHDFDHHEHDH